MLIETYTELDQQWGLGLAGLDRLTDQALANKAVGALKQRSGFHAQYIEVLPETHLPEVACAYIDAVVDVARGVRVGPVTMTVTP